jgi:UTP--glucose-1-phosphate uridylyltransferase
MKVRKAILPVAGLGTRFLPATKAQPKEMLPLVDKPVVQYALEEAKESLIELAILVTGRGKETIENHFDVSFELEQLLRERGEAELLHVVEAIEKLPQIAYVRQRRALGLGHAVYTAQKLVGEEPFAVMLPDDVIISKVPCLRQMSDVYERHGCSVIAIQQVPQEQTGRYGVIKGRPLNDSACDGRLYEIEDMVEKPSQGQAPSDLAIIGRYILTAELFPELEHTKPSAKGEIQLTDALKSLLSKGKRILGYRFEGKRYDAGDKPGFLEATVGIALSRPDLGEGMRAYLRSLDL